MASFSNDVKKELVSSITDMDKRYACLYGVLLFCRNITDKAISLSTESSEFAELFPEIVKSVFKETVTVNTEITQKKNGTNIYNLSIRGREQVKIVLSRYDISSNRKIDMEHIVNNSLSAFLAGVFFVCGSVSDPYKEYHLEFIMPEEGLFDDLHAVLLELAIDGRKTERKGTTVLYIKDSENIEDILTFLGARQSTIDIMNIKIYKDVRNKVNRIANCDSANIDKVIRASSKQIDDIKFIIAQGEFEKLSSDLRETAELRLENPELTLQEIGELLKKPIGRSGVMRRFKKISQIADDIRNNG